MVHNILPSGVECIFVSQPVQLGLGHAVLCAERVVGNEPFAVLLADDFIVSNEAGVTSDLLEGFAKAGKTQICAMQVDGPDISKYGVIKKIANLVPCWAGLRSQVLKTRYPTLQVLGDIF